MTVTNLEVRIFFCDSTFWWGEGGGGGERERGWVFFFSDSTFWWGGEGGGGETRERMGCVVIL